MGFINNLWTAVKDTVWEFQAGPTKADQKKRKRPAWLLKRIKMDIKRRGRQAARTQPIRKAPKEIVRPNLVHLPAETRYVIKRERVFVDPPKSVRHEVVPWEEVIDERDTGINEQIDTPQERVERVVTEPVKKKIRKNRNFYDTALGKRRKHLLFMNPGTDKINEATRALVSGSALPVWATPFEAHLSIKKGALMFDNLKMATHEEKRHAVKHQYFDPKGPSTINPICEKLRETYANISRGNVQTILRSLETYQRNFGRRRPPSITGRMVLKSPGIIAMDMFFPTKKIAGWEGKYACLTCMDCWSRFCHVYALEKKDLPSQVKAMSDFLQKFAAFGYMPRRILTDKGSDMRGAYKVIEVYRTKKDGDAPMVGHSKTAQPVNIVEAMNAQVQRRMQVFRTSGLTDDPSILLEDISYAINHQKRPDRGNLTPVQLLSLNKEEIARVNEMWEDRTDIPEVHGLRRLRVGDSVRVLLMTRKQQAQNTVKGFTAKWTREVYTVLKKAAIPRNRSNYRYWVGLHKSYFRHELLWVPRTLDSEVVDLLVHKQQVVAEGENWSDLEYDSDDSRA